MLSHNPAQSTQVKTTLSHAHPHEGRPWLIRLCCLWRTLWKPSSRSLLESVMYTLRREQGGEKIHKWMEEPSPQRQTTAYWNHYVLAWWCSDVIRLHILSDSSLLQTSVQSWTCLGLCAVTLRQCPELRRLHGLSYQNKVRLRRTHHSSKTMWGS